MIIIINNHYDSTYNRWTVGSGFVRLARPGGWAEGEAANRFGEDSRDTGGSIGINSDGGDGAAGDSYVNGAGDGMLMVMVMDHDGNGGNSGWGRTPQFCPACNRRDFKGAAAFHQN